MSSCRKCYRPVCFEEKVQSMGFNFHPDCLRCGKCNKHLSPGQHFENEGIPFCPEPCYSALFKKKNSGSESHSSSETVANKSNIPRTSLEKKLTEYNKYYEDTKFQLSYRKDDATLLEGVIKIYWGISEMVHLQEDIDRRSKWGLDLNRRLPKTGADGAVNNPGDGAVLSVDQEPNNTNGHSENEFNSDFTKNTCSSPTRCDPLLDRPTYVNLKRRKGVHTLQKNREVQLRRSTESSNLETSAFCPPPDSVGTVWVTSRTDPQSAISILLDKYKIRSHPVNFNLWVVKDNGERRLMQSDEIPLLTRVFLGPYEDFAKIYICSSKCSYEVTPEMAQYYNLSYAECLAILKKFYEEEEKELQLIRMKYSELTKVIGNMIRMKKNSFMLKL